MNTGADEPLPDHGRYSQPVSNDEIQGHHTDRWQNHAMYVGLHFPQQRGKRRRHHRRTPKDKSEEDHTNSSEKSRALPSLDEVPSDTGYQATPPSQRVQFILGREVDDEDPDHQTHDIFCEMDELRHMDDGGVEWKETARWIKFEEDVEEGGERWSKPHVATLSLHSLFELRKGIMSGTVMLDLDANNLHQITDLVLENMVASKQLEEENREAVQEVLLSRHRHQHDKKSEGRGIIRTLTDIGKKSSSKNLEEPKKGGGMKQSASASHLPSSMTKNGSRDKAMDQDGAIKESASGHKFNEHFAKKIPPGAEASNILVGEVEFLTHPVIAFVRLAKASMLGDLTEVPVPTRFIFILLGGVGNQQRYHEIGRSIATLMSDEVFHDVAYKATSRDDLLSGIDEFLDQVTVLPPGEWDPTIRIEPPKKVPSQEARKGPHSGGAGGGGGVPNGMVVQEEEEEHVGDPTLLRTGRLFGGLINDIKRKLPWYLSDYKDGIHIQCLASFGFIYFACLAPIITFGGLLGAATNNNMAAMESLVTGAIAGVTWHLFSGQPLTIIGSTGPVLVFETIVYNFATSYGLYYLTLRLWIGLWMALALFLMVMFDLSSLVRYITRFTEESFALLIALIFVVEAFKKLIDITHKSPINLHPGQILDYNCSCEPKYDEPENTTEMMGSTTPYMTTFMNFANTTEFVWDGKDRKACKEAGMVLVGTGCDTPYYVADVFFFCCLVFIGTYVISFGLKMSRNSRFFPTKVRALISDFAVMIAIASMSGLDALIGLETPKLEVPQKFKPTRDDRGWFVPPFRNPVWTIPAAIAPALLATILIFMDQQITAVIVNRKENKLKKGNGYHLDLLVISIQIVVCSFIGTPWFVAATVLSINHVRSLTRESETSAPGERPAFLGVREQRLTGVIVFIVIGCSVLITPVLRKIPMAVLYGVFLFMGTSSLRGVQLMQRISIMFMPAKYQPDYTYLRHVPLRRVHIFTVVQIMCLAGLWIIKYIKEISIVFPLTVLAMCFVRKALDWVFTRHELKWLDDIMPEAHKRAKEDEKKAIEEEQSKVIEMEGGAVNIPLRDGKSIHIPVDRITIDPQSNQVKISEDMSKKAIWKQLAANESDPKLKCEDLPGYRMRQRKSSINAEDTAKVKSKENVKLRINDEETQGLMSPPEIVVDPPSKPTSPNNKV